MDIVSELRCVLRGNPTAFKAANEIERLRTENKAWRDYVQGMCVGAAPVVAVAPTTGQATIVLVTQNDQHNRQP